MKRLSLVIFVLAAFAAPGASKPACCYSHRLTTQSLCHFLAHHHLWKLPPVCQTSATVFGSLFVFALSAAGVIYLVLELGQPFAGLMQISSAPLRNVLTPVSP
jgi:hypothetical protein